MKLKLLVFILFVGSTIALKAQYADMYIMKGNAKDEIGDLAGAIADYTAAIEDDSTYAMAYFNRGWVKRKLNDYEGAIEDYTSALKFKPGYQIAFHNRGICYMLMGKKDEACTDWEKAWALGYPDAKKLLDGFCYGNEWVPK